MQAGSGSLCLYMLEGAFPLESPLTIYHSRRISCQWKPFGVGSGLGLLTGVSPSRKKPAGVAQKARGSAWGAPEKAVGSGRSPRRGQPPAASHPGLEGACGGPGGLGGGVNPPPILLHRKNKSGSRDPSLTASGMQCPRMKMCRNALSVWGEALRTQEDGSTQAAGASGSSGACPAAPSPFPLPSGGSGLGVEAAVQRRCSYITARRVLLPRGVGAGGRAGAGAAAAPAGRGARRAAGGGRPGRRGR